MTATTLVTGADGYLGRLTAARLLADADESLVLSVRASDATELATKRQGLRAWLGERAWPRVTVVAADVRDEHPFERVDQRAITRILHAAAVVRFNVEEPLARAVNIEGAAKVAAFARDCPNLERLVLCSTVYTAGRATGPVQETPHDGLAGFTNFYEWSKWEAEHLALQSCRDLPLTIARLATVVSDGVDGSVTQYNAFHNTLRLFFYGLLSLLPGTPDTPIYLVTGDFSAAALVHLLLHDQDGGIFHVCPARGETPRLGDAVDAAFAVFEHDRDFCRRGLLRPLYCDAESFDDLLEAAEGLGGSPLRQALASVAPFAAQLYLDKDVSNARLRSSFPVTFPNPRALVEATCAHLVSVRWGRREALAS